MARATLEARKDAWIPDPEQFRAVLTQALPEILERRLGPGLGRALRPDGGSVRLEITATTGGVRVRVRNLRPADAPVLAHQLEREAPLALREAITQAVRQTAAGRSRR